MGFHTEEDNKPLPWSVWIMTGIASAIVPIILIVAWLA